MLIIDRFEGDYAVCEDDNRDMRNIERSKLPRNAKEGDVIIVKDGTYAIDHQETKKRRFKIKNLMDTLWD